jgi:tetratricopeptide (TPR) repeat protein
VTRPEATADVTLTLFERHVKEALRLYDRPERLGGESPLASPYVLGRTLVDLPRPVTERARGVVLCSELRAAACQLWRGKPPTTRAEMLEAIASARRNPEDPHYSYVVLELRAFHECITPNRTSDIWEQPHLLPGSKSQHYRDFDAAVKRVAALLLDRLRPALRPERPRPPEVLYGYDRQLAILAGALERGASVAISGPGGVGKTSIAALALAHLQHQRVFWYTLRPGFNDRVSSLLFALGAFLHEQGASNLWQYLMTSNGVVGDLNLAAGLLRQDCSQLGDRPLLFCLDDLEHLSAGDLAPSAPAHAQLLSLIDELRAVAPMLLIGQRGLPASDVHLELSGLDIAHAERFWSDAGVELPREEALRLHQYSGGNPRILTLLLALKRMGEDLVLEGDGATAISPLLPAFERLWQRLHSEERRALQRLSVYQSYAPDDLLPPGTLASLERLRLIERDGEGGVTLLPALAPIVRRGLSPELREQLHGDAAIAHLERGEYTSAAYHFAQGNQENRAVQAWFPQRRQAIARGEGEAARQIFSELSRQRLHAGERKALDVLRAELRQLGGELDQGLRELEQADWNDESEAGARLWMLRGELQDALGYPDQALASFAEGIRVTSRMLGQLAVLHQRRGLLYYRRRNLAASWGEIHRAQFDLEVLRGLVRTEEGAYDDALEAYQRASELAEQLDDDLLRAQAARQLAAVWGRRERLDQVVTHAARALAIYERLGDQVNLEKMRSNLSAVYVQTRQPREALAAGLPAYEFFQAVRDPYFAAATGANLAEASFELGDYESATRYAREVLALGDRHAAPYACYTLGQIAMACQDTAGAVEWFGDSMRRAQLNDDPYMVAYAQRSLGEAYLRHEPPSARQHLEGALAIFRQLAIESEIAATEQLVQRA